MPHPPDPLAVLFALHAEAGPFRRAIGPYDGEGTPTDPAWGSVGGTGVVWAVTGMGKQRAHDGAASLISQTAPRALLIAGFCGGLAPVMRIGEMVCATRCLSAGHRESLQPAQPWVDAALAALRDRKRAIHCGTLLSVDRPLPTPEVKAAMRSAWPNATAVDMESYGAAEAAETAGVPWLAIRCVTDGPDDVLPSGLDRVSADGQPDGTAIALAATLRPWRLPRLAATARAASRAALELGSAVLVVAAATAALHRPLRRSGCG